MPIHRIIHMTSYSNFERILRDKTVFARTGVSWASSTQYEVNSGPFFFLEGHLTEEKPKSPLYKEVEMHFTCTLTRVDVLRSAVNAAIAAGEFQQYRWKLIVELNPHSHKISQARIIPDSLDCLTLERIIVHKSLFRHVWWNSIIQRKSFDDKFYSVRSKST